ncbi:MAG: hypothetical protein AAB225_20205 [Acidobacteriota bacterium]
MFQSPLGGSPPAGAPAPPSSLQPEQPGEFTRMFQSPVAPGPPRSESPVAGPPPGPPPPEFPPAGFGVPPPAPLGPPPARGGEFTRLFGPGAGAPEPAAPPAFSGSPRGGATELFTTPTVPPPAPMPPVAGAGPGEFTRIVGVSPPPVEAVPAQSPAPGLAAPKPTGPPGARSNLPLFLIAGFALLVTIALIVYFLVLR